MNYQAVLFISFGGPEKREEIAPFLEIVARGRGIPKARLEEVAHHYEVIGGKSPINEITRRQASALRSHLASAGCPLPVYIGQRNWHLFLEDALRQMAADGIQRAIGFITAAHRCEASWERYVNAVEEARRRIGARQTSGEASPAVWRGSAPEIDYVKPWFDHPLFIDAICERIKETLKIPSPAALPSVGLALSPGRGEPNKKSPLPGERVQGEGVFWVFTAHSIPVPMAESSRYVQELKRTAELVAERFGKSSWALAYSSRSGRPQDPWLEPDVCDIIRRQAARGVKNILFIPIGFIADHVEVLFDLDVEAKEAADAAGVHLDRASTVGDHPLFARMMADVILKRCSAERRSAERRFA